MEVRLPKLYTRHIEVLRKTIQPRRILQHSSKQRNQFQVRLKYIAIIVGQPYSNDYVAIISFTKTDNSTYTTKINGE